MRPAILILAAALLALALSSADRGARQPVTDYNWHDAAEDHDARACGDAPPEAPGVDVDTILDSLANAGY